jgi:hypothetical protein
LLYPVLTIDFVAPQISVRKRHRFRGLSYSGFTVDEVHLFALKGQDFICAAQILILVIASELQSWAKTSSAVAALVLLIVCTTDATRAALSRTHPSRLHRF